MSAMRTPWVGLLVVITMTSAARAQGPLPEPSFVLKLKDTKLDLPNSNSSTCLAVFPDGRFHMEQTSELPSSEHRIFEDSIPDDSLRSLSTILETRELKDLRTVKTGPVEFAQGEVVWAVMPRQGTTQKLLFVSLDGAAGQPSKPFPASLEPLVQWVHVTIRALNQRKLHPVKKANPVRCWLLEQ
jgi:hypothetical protein